jgi:hypothetical protein
MRELCVTRETLNLQREKDKKEGRLDGNVPIMSTEILVIVVNSCL